jgi:hypothetical protein
MIAFDYVHNYGIEYAVKNIDKIKDYLINIPFTRDSILTNRMSFIDILYEERNDLWSKLMMENPIIEYKFIENYLKSMRFLYKACIYDMEMFPRWIKLPEINEIKHFEIIFENMPACKFAYKTTSDNDNGDIVGEYDDIFKKINESGIDNEIKKKMSLKVMENGKLDEDDEKFLEYSKKKFDEKILEYKQNFNNKEIPSENSVDKKIPSENSVDDFRNYIISVLENNNWAYSKDNNTNQLYMIIVEKFLKIIKPLILEKN